ncbi:ABC transporter substrate-binding protein [Pseudarthrobacter sp. H2]|uniref:ABC transporter substrate-binding protein n=1 Tax=Pseudarthrobacter sp. H2 TaxID=3418415 RepID=UPI003CF66C91
MKRAGLLVAVATAAAIGLSGCGGGADGASAAGTELTIQASPVADYAALYVGIEQGMFAAQGLNVKSSVGQSGAATVAAVMSGEIAVGGSAVVPLINASARNVPVRLVAPAGTSADGDKDYIGLVVAPDSKVAGPADLTNANVAVNGLKSFLELVTRKAIDTAGGKSEGTKFLDMPNSEMQRAVQRGQVDAAVMNEPFLSQAKSAGLKVIGFPNKAVSKDLLVSGYFVSEQYAKQNPQVIQKLQTAFAAAQDYANEHPDEVRKILETNSKVAKGSLQQVQLPRYVKNIDKSVLDDTITTMKQYGFIEKPVKADDFLLGAS